MCIPRYMNVYKYMNMYAYYYAYVYTPRRPQPFHKMTDCINT